MIEQEGKYLNYSIEDFVWDDEFRLWIISPTEESEYFWRNWLLEHPHKKAVLISAEQIVKALVPQSDSIKLTDVEFQVDQIFLKRNTESIPKEPSKFYRFNTSVLFRAAAVLVFVVGIAALLFIRKINMESLNTVKTASGIQKSVILSDSSIVVLNSNSSLKFKKNWKNSEAREIWLEGEGYFEVKHLDKDKRIVNHERFLVHVKGVTVEVLGTTFNIRNRRGKTEIVLKEGSIKLSFDNHRQKDILMTPEEIITVENDTDKTVSISKVKPDEYSAWIHQHLILNNTHVSDIIQYLEDNYGKKIILSDSSLRNKRIEGKLILDNLDDALFVLSKVLKVKVEQNDSSIYFKKM